MARWMMIIFASLTLGASILTYQNVGLEKTHYEEPSIRSGSGRIGASGSYIGYGSGSGGGYSYGK